MNFDTISTSGFESSFEAMNEPKTPPIYELTSMLKTAKIKYITELYATLMSE